MRKIALVIATITMLAFVGCNKFKQCRCTVDSFREVEKIEYKNGEMVKTKEIVEGNSIQIVQTKEKCSDLDIEYIDEKGFTTEKTVCKKDR